MSNSYIKKDPLEMIPCRYLVVKYVEDDIRDEPINIGIILRSQNDRKTIFKFISCYRKLGIKREEIVFIKKVLNKIHNKISESNDKDILNKISSKSIGKIKFTESRGLLTENLDREIISLFERYISIEKPKKIYWNKFTKINNVFKKLLSKDRFIE
jgi:hypothetical protein